MNSRKWALPFAVRWSSTAWQQYQDAMDFVAADKPQAALEKDASITSAVARLGAFPKMFEWVKQHADVIIADKIKDSRVVRCSNSRTVFSA